MSGCNRRDREARAPSSLGRDAHGPSSPDRKGGSSAPRESPSRVAGSERSQSPQPCHCLTNAAIDTIYGTSMIGVHQSVPTAHGACDGYRSAAMAPLDGCLAQPQPPRGFVVAKDGSGDPSYRCGRSLTEPHGPDRRSPPMPCGGVFTIDAAMETQQPDGRPAVRANGGVRRPAPNGNRSGDPSYFASGGMNFNWASQARDCSCQASHIGPL